MLNSYLHNETCVYANALLHHSSPHTAICTRPVTDGITNNRNQSASVCWLDYRILRILLCIFIFIHIINWTGRWVNEISFEQKANIIEKSREEYVHSSNWMQEIPLKFEYIVIENVCRNLSAKIRRLKWGSKQNDRRKKLNSAWEEGRRQLLFTQHCESLIRLIK